MNQDQPLHPTSTMSQGGSFHDAGGEDEEERTGYDVFDWTTRVISIDIYDLLQNPDVPEWDSGTVILEEW